MGNSLSGRIGLKVGTSDQIILELRKYYTENPPDSIEDEKLRLETFALDYLLKKIGPLFPTIKRREVLNTLEGPREVGKPWFTKGGIIAVFEKAVVYDAPRDAISYWLNKRGRKKAFGEFKGWMFGEIPLMESGGRLIFEYTMDEVPIEARKQLRRTLREHRIPRWAYNKYHARNTLNHYASPGFKPKTPRERDQEIQARLERRKQRDLKKK